MQCSLHRLPSVHKIKAGYCHMRLPGKCQLQHALPEDRVLGTCQACQGEDKHTSAFSEGKGEAGGVLSEKGCWLALGSMSRAAMRTFRRLELRGPHIYLQTAQSADVSGHLIVTFLYSCARQWRSMGLTQLQCC